MALMFRALSLSAVVALAACSGDSLDTVGPQSPSITGIAQAALSGLIRRPAPDQPQGVSLEQLRANLTPARRAEIGRPVILAQRQPSGATAALIESARNGGVRTFITPDGLSVALDRGVLVATRGLAPDLMIASSTSVLSRLQSGSGEVERVFRWIGTGERLEVDRLNCQYDRENDVIIERCRSASGGGFDNRYWLRSNGTIRASTQLISPAAGYLYIEMP